MHTYNQELLPEEIDILKRMTNLPIDVDAMVVNHEMYRAAQRMRSKMERRCSPAMGCLGMALPCCIICGSGKGWRPGNWNSP